jgi:hypothetical protein
MCNAKYPVKSVCVFINHDVFVNALCGVCCNCVCVVIVWNSVEVVAS